MTKAEIREAFSAVSDREDLLKLVNSIKTDDLGEKAHAFTLGQLNYFCNSARNAKCYKTFTIPKKSGKLREISAPSGMLKSLQHYTGVLLQALYVPKACVMGFTPGRSVVSNAQMHVNKPYILNMDLKDFFPSISKYRVRAVLKAKPICANEDVADVIANLCCTRTSDNENEIGYHGVLPQGSPASPVLTNIVCQSLDSRIMRLARKYKVTYTRYADDMTFSSMTNCFKEGSDFLNGVFSIIEKEGFIINAEKTRLQKRGERQEVTGLTVSDRVNVTRSYVRDLGSLLFIWEKYGIGDARRRFLSHYTPKPNRNVVIPPMESVIAGKLMYLKMVKGETDPVLKRLDNRFKKLVKIYEHEVKEDHTENTPQSYPLVKTTVPEVNDSFVIIDSLIDNGFDLNVLK